MTGQDVVVASFKTKPTFACSEHKVMSEYLLYDDLFDTEEDHNILQ
jgi:hypothetical protein